MRELNLKNVTLCVLNKKTSVRLSCRKLWWKPHNIWIYPISSVPQITRFYKETPWFWGKINSYWLYSGWVFSELLADGDKKRGQKDRLPKICHTCLAMMKLDTVIPYLKEIQKCINHVRQPLRSAGSSIFHLKLAIFVASRSKYKNSILINNL